MQDVAFIQFDEDINLMIKVREGDRSAYGQICTRDYPTVLSFFLSRHRGQKHECEDMAQEVFTRIWQQRADYRPLAPVKYYLVGVAANVLRESHARMRSRVRASALRSAESPSDAQQSSPEMLVESNEQTQAVLDLLVRLPTRQRQSLELVYLAGLSSQEAALRLGCSSRTIRVNCHRGIKKLRILCRERLFGHGPDGGP